MGFLKAAKNHFVASLGEFVGTFLFLFFAFGGTQIANQPTAKSQNANGPDLTGLLYISLIFGFSLAINVWIFFRVSGGIFNPAVTLALCITGVVPIWRSVFIFIIQILGAIAAAGVIRGLIPGNDVLFNCKLRPGTAVVQGLFLEMFLTAELVLTILMLAAEKTKVTFVAPVGIGLALFAGELVGVYWTGGALNPARAFGPQVVMGSFEGYHWIYWIGPFLGALLASAFYGLIKYLRYEEVNGNQDLTLEEELEKLVDDGGESGTGGKKRNDDINGNNKAFEGSREQPHGSNRSYHQHHRTSSDDYDQARAQQQYTLFENNQPQSHDQRSPVAAPRFSPNSPVRTSYSERRKEGMDTEKENGGDVRDGGEKHVDARTDAEHFEHQQWSRG